MPAIPLTEDNISGNITANTKISYPDPFFDLAKNYIPKNIKTLFKFCRTFFYTSSFLRNVVTKLTEYPITDILYDNTIDTDTKAQYDEVLHRKLKIKSFLIEIGLDYFTYGNAFISTYMKPTRFLKCSNCKAETQIDLVNYKLEKFEFRGICPACRKANILFTPRDEYIKSIDNFKLVRWAPENIDIEYNPLSGSSTYYYTIPSQIKSAILLGNKTVLKEVPLIFLESLKKKKRIQLDENNLFHFKRPTLAEDDMGWGKPIILPALKDIYYLQILKRGNEAIAQEYIVPNRIMFPQNTVTLDPFTQLNLGKWRSQIEEQIRKWKYDPNHIGVFPIPVGYQQLGGNARALLLTPEMRFLEETIINSLGVPLEFVKGGSTWTGSSVSLRIVENHFITYRELLEDFLNYFLVYKLVNNLSYAPTKLKFQKFKMADDIQSKNLALQLSEAGKVSDAKLLDEFGYSFDEETEALRRSRTDRLEETIAQREIDAEGQGRAALILAKYQAKAQTIASNEAFAQEIELFQEELTRENIGIPDDPSKIIEKYAITVLAMPPAKRDQFLRTMSQNMPITYTMVLKRIQQYQANQLQNEAYIQSMLGTRTETASKPQTGLTKKEMKEKTKGNTRGEPQ